MTPAAPEMARLGLTDAAAPARRRIWLPAVDLTLAPTGGAAGLRFVRFTDAAGGTLFTWSTGRLPVRLHPPSAAPARRPPARGPAS